MGSPEIPSLLQEIQQEVQVLKQGDEQSRQALLDSARALVSALESPAERVARISFHEPTLSTAIRICIDMKLFESLVADNGTPKTTEQLAKLTGSDPKLLERFLKHLATGGIVRETGTDQFAPNEISKVFATPTGQGVFTNCFDGITTISSRFPEFMKNTQYTNPKNKDKSAFKFSHNTDKHYFEWCFSPGNEYQAEAFHNHMKFKTLSKKWFECVPVDDLFADFKSSDPDGVLMVDVGGDTGYDALNFHKAYPNLPGRLVVQDLPASIAKLDKEAIKPVEAMPHDFFTPQPVKNAKAFYLKMVLHDWPDASCREILSNLRPALVPGYTKILINEIVVPDMDADWFSTSVDMLMMLFHSAEERREKDWRTLIESVEGLKVVKIWECGGAPEKLIEVELA
ncbi:S-adenosyl-L-methionine-dependent methyltransferase [Rhizodiscina lignyota]|uniref:S-adenosyl-L-methionine-dependent methyltransferase n=1 Tax=Rhizodiscina lignyota TaxID=1504668 RepID=A0A9P4IDB6_9PEZI|nr:S-adenosyl-L-methionine-dependent methyltransferase [Rhizodiscina lignyota]